MPSDSAALLVHIQIALGLSQKELGALVGRTKRTIQRWQDSGVVTLDEDQATILAAHLRPARPDLAEQVLTLGRPAQTTGQLATPEALAAILGAAGAAGGMSPEGARPLVLAAFQQAAAEGVDVGAVVVALRSGG
jgi:hypothetical protein